jgi:hypothetical protein
MACFVPSLKVIEMRTDKSQPDSGKTAEPVSQAATLGSLRLAAMRLSDARKKPLLKTRDLVGMLLSHGARAWRSSQYPVHVKLSVRTPDGSRAVTYSYRTPPIG